MNILQKFSIALLPITSLMLTACEDLASLTNSECDSVCLRSVESGNAQAIFSLVWDSELVTEVEELDHFQLRGNLNSFGPIEDNLLLNNIDKNDTQLNFHAPLHLFNPNVNQSTGLTLVAVDTEGDTLESWEVVSELEYSSPLVSYLKGNASIAENNFGHASAISADGSLLVTSAPGYSGTESQQGAVYTFERNKDYEWKSMDVLLPPPEYLQRNGHFGEHLQLSNDGEVLVVTQSNDQSGRNTPVYVYEAEDDRWKLVAPFIFEDVSLGDYDIADITLSKKSDTLTLAFGLLAKGPNSTPNPARSEVHIYEFDIYDLDINAENKVIGIKLPSPNERSGFGSTLAFSDNGEILAVGAPNGDTGAAYIYRKERGEWERNAELKGLEGLTYRQQFGSTVELSGDGQVLAVGARCEGGTSIGLEGEPPSSKQINCAGAVYVYRQTGSNPWANFGDEPKFDGWEEYVKSQSTRQDEFFGEHIQLSENGDILVVSTQRANGAARGTWGSPEDQSKTDSGAAFMYLYNGAGQWRVGNYIKASNTDANDNFGFSLALSSDGETLAIGAPAEASNAEGVSGHDQSNNSTPGAGAVYVY